MTNILLVVSSPRGPESLSTRFASEVAEGLRAKAGGTVTVRDLAATPLPHITQAYIHGRHVSEAERSSEQTQAVGLAQTLVDEVMAADVIVLGSGMINFGLSSQLKAWFDYITWPGVTFMYEEAGPKGLLPPKKVYVVTASGAIYSEGQYTAFDHQTNYLALLLGFMGLTDVEIIRLEGTYLGPDAAAAAIASTEAQIKTVLQAVA